MKIAIISSSVRKDRKSHRVALYLEKHIHQLLKADVEILDLCEYAFPLFQERIWNLDPPPEGLVDYAERFRAADGIVIVSPVYNGSFPAALKNAIDVLYHEWNRKPAMVVSVSDGKTPGIATVQMLQTLLLKMGARVAGGMYTVVNAPSGYSEEGIPENPEQAAKYAARPLEELNWIITSSLERLQ